MAGFFFSRSFTDFDEYNAAVKAWDLEFLQLGHGQFHADALQFGDQDIQIAKVRYNKLLLQNGSAPQQGYTFAVHHDQSAPFLWRYQDFDYNSIIVFPENRELHGVSQPGHHPFVVSISEEMLAKVSIALGFSASLKFIVKGSISHCDPTQMANIRSFLTTVCHLMSVTQGGNSGLFINDASKWHLTSLLLASLAKSKNVKPRKRNLGNRRKIIEKLVEFIDSDISSPKSIEQLCSVADVNERTLRNMFYEQFSISPQKFIKSHRLNSARNILQRSTPDNAKVIDAANACGFWHMGQFAKDYFRQFGELPYDTMDRL